MHKVAVVTGGRADYGLLTPLLKAIDECAMLQLQLVVTGYHLSAAHGETWRQIEADGFAIAATVTSQQSGDSHLAMARSLGQGVLGMSETLHDLAPDAVVVLGDRYEILAAAEAALLLSIPLIHIHGGELTQGAIDDAIRHAISKMASLHFVSTEEHRRRLLQMGEDERRVFNTGALAVDNVAQVELLSVEDFNARFGTHLKPGFLLVTLHPETATDLEPEQFAKDVCLTLQPYIARGILITKSNADAGGGAINRVMAEFSQAYETVWHFNALGLQGYLSAVSHAAVVIGNSSSGLIEVPVIGTPTLDIGERQKSRFAPPSVTHCQANVEDISQALKQIIDNPPPGNPASCYGQPGVAVRMVRLISLALSKRLVKSPFVDREWI